MNRTAMAIASAAFAACACAKDIHTSSWGVCWRRPELMRQSVSVTNTPGSDAFCKVRFTDAAIYAFLDGFDTRMNKTCCTNLVTDNDGNTDFSPNAERQVTNTTYRFAFFDSVDDRNRRLRHLTLDDPIDWYYYNKSYDGYWGSSFMDGLGLSTPVRHDFSWTEDVVSEFYNGYQSGWFPVFYGLRHSGTFIPRDIFENGRYDDKFCGLAYYLISDVTFYDDKFMQLDGKYMHGDLDATPYPFETVLTNAFREVETTNIVNHSRRMQAQALAGSNQALSLFDRRVRQDNEVAAFTNRTETHYRVRISAKGMYGGNVEIKVDDTGEYEANPLNLSFIPEKVTTNLTTSVTNYPCWRSAPRLFISKPEYSFGASVRIEASVDGATSIGPDGGFLCDALASVFFCLEGDEHEITLSGINLGNAIGVSVYAGNLDFGTYYAGMARIVPGYYFAEGTATFSASYYKDSTHRIDFGRNHESWPADCEYLKANGLAATFLSSYACVYDAGKDQYIRFIDYGGTARDDWYNRKSYGYRAHTDRMHSPGYYLGSLHVELNEILSMMTAQTGPHALPFEYMGIEDGDFGKMCEDADDWTFKITDVWFGTDEQSNKKLTVRRMGNGKFKYKWDDKTGFIDYYPIFTLNASLFATPISLSRFGFTDRSLMFQSKIRSVSESTWDFPQVRTK